MNTGEPRSSNLQHRLSLQSCNLFHLATYWNSWFKYTSSTHSSIYISSKKGGCDKSYDLSMKPLPKSEVMTLAGFALC